MSVTESATVLVRAPLEQVLEKLRDIDHQKDWFPDNLESQVLERDEHGRCVRGRMVNDVKVVKDDFVLDYTHSDTGFAWRLTSPTRVQKDQQGSWTLVDKGGATEATMRLTLDPSIPLPGFVQKRIVTGTVRGATKALAAQF